MSVQKIVEKIDAIEAQQDKKISAAVESVKAEFQAVVDKLEAKVGAAPAVVRSVGEKSVRADVNRRANESVKKALKEVANDASKSVEVKLFESVEQHSAYMKEASGLTGSGDGKGGRTAYDPVFHTARQMNPLRETSRIVSTDGSRYQFRVKTGNGGVTWGYPVQNNGAATTVDSASWDVVLQDLNAQFPIRTAALADIDGLESNVVDDFMAEFSQAEGGAFVANNPGAAAGTGYQVGPNGPRGLNSYGAAGAITAGSIQNAALNGNGNHSLATVGQGSFATASASNITVQDLLNVMNTIPVQYRTQNMAWHINPIQWQFIRGLRDNNGAPIVDRNDTFGVTGYEMTLFGYRVILNNYIDSPLGAGGTTRFPVYFGDWSLGHTIIDSLTLSIKRYDQTQPGFITFYGEKRTQTAVKDPFALARLASTV